MMPLMAWMVPDWRFFSAICGFSVVLPLIFSPWIPESPRWLLSQVRRIISICAKILIEIGTSRSLQNYHTAWIASGG
jgi:hypothetical protein